MNGFSVFKGKIKKMTKLLEWLSCGTVFFGLWFAAITSNSSFVKEWHEVILFLPVIFLFQFGLYAIIVVLYRVFTFNTCESAAIELQQEIQQAVKDLQKKGVTLRGTNISLTS